MHPIKEAAIREIVRLGMPERWADAACSVLGATFDAALEAGRAESAEARAADRGPAAPEDGGRAFENRRMREALLVFLPHVDEGICPDCMHAMRCTVRATFVNDMLSASAGALGVDEQAQLNRGEDYLRGYMAGQRVGLDYAKGLAAPSPDAGAMEAACRAFLDDFAQYVAAGLEPEQLLYKDALSAAFLAGARWGVARLARSG